jgi:hypothetical protein
MSKLWAVALLACALGNSAHATNVSADQVELREGLHTCWTGGYGSLDFPKGYGANQALFPGR